jgi:hypothetical protein
MTVSHIIRGAGYKSSVANQRPGSLILALRCLDLDDPAQKRAAEGPTNRFATEIATFVRESGLISVGSCAITTQTP